MTADTQTFISELTNPYKEGVLKIREVILQNLPEGFEEKVHGKMLYYVVPYSLYPAGYHCKPKQPLPFIALAPQKKYIAVHHMGMYAEPSLLTWFTDEYPKYSTEKADIGKGCIRFKKEDQIPYELLGKLMKKMSVEEWIKVYEKTYKK